MRVETVMADRPLDDLTDAFYYAQAESRSAANERQRTMRDHRLYRVLRMLAIRTEEAAGWLDEHFHTGQDDVWLDVLRKYERAMTALQTGVHSSSVSSSTALTTSRDASSLPVRNLTKRESD